MYNFYILTIFNKLYVLFLKYKKIKPLAYVLARGFTRNKLPINILLKVFDHLPACRWRIKSNCSFIKSHWNALLARKNDLTTLFFIHFFSPCGIDRFDGDKVARLPYQVFFISRAIQHDHKAFEIHPKISDPFLDERLVHKLNNSSNRSYAFLNMGSSI